MTLVTRTKQVLRDRASHMKEKVAHGRLLEKAGGCALRVSRRLASNPHLSPNPPKRCTLELTQGLMGKGG